MTCNPVQAEVSVWLWTGNCLERVVEADARVRGQEAGKRRFEYSDVGEHEEKGRRH